MKWNTMQHLNIVGLFVEAAEQYPDRIAIIHRGKSIRYGQLLREVRRTASYFEKKGVRKGDRVLVFIPMSIDLYRIVLALFYVGATAVFLDAWSGVKRVEECVEIAECRGFIGHWKARLIRWLLPSARKIPLLLKLRGRGEADGEVAAVQGEDPALITFTTGSTGRPKAALRNHNFLRIQYEVLNGYIHPDAGDVVMTTLPIVLLVNLGVGACSVIPDAGLHSGKSVDAGVIVDQMSRYRVSRLIASPQFGVEVATFLAGKHRSLPHLKEVYTGGGPVFSDMALQLKKGFPDAHIQVIYGSTEAEPISHIAVDQLIYLSGRQNDGLPAGEIYPGTDLRIIHTDSLHNKSYTSSEWEALCCPEGEIGEIVVAGDHVLKHYYKSPEAWRQAKIKAGSTLWHRTGDSGFVRDGQLYLTGRVKRLIQYGSRKIAPFVVEAALRQSPGIRRAALMDTCGQLILAIEPEERSNGLKEIAGSIPHDRMITFESIPLDPRHRTKVDYTMLEKMIQEIMDGEGILSSGRR